MESRVIIGKCEEELFKLDPWSVHMIITSPPYNANLEYGNGFDDNKPESEYYDWVEKWLAGCYHVLCDGGRIAINIPFMTNVNKKKGNGLQSYIDNYLPLMRQAGFTIRDIICWGKKRKEDDEMSFCGSSTAWGSWKAPSNPFCRSFAELIVVAHKGSDKREPEGRISDITEDEFKRYTRNLWQFPAESDRSHPAPFPDELPYRLIRLYTYIGDTVLDPFSGRGTTVRVAKKLNRKALGIEQNPNFVGMLQYIQDE